MNGAEVDEQAVQTLDLRDYLRVLRRRKWVVATTALLVVVVALTFSLLQTPVYTASARLTVEPIDEPQGEASALRQLVYGPQELETQREVITSVWVAQLVVERLGLDQPVSDLLEMVSARIVGESQVLEVTAESTDAQEAASIAQGFAESFLEQRRREALDERLAAVTALEQRAAEVRQSLAEIADEGSEAEGIDRQAREQEENALLSQLGSIQAQIATLSAPAAFVSSGGTVIRPAEVPTAPSSPKPLRTGVLAVVLGLMLGVGLAFLRDFLDDSIRSDEEAVRAVGRPVLGHIPRWKDAATAEGAQRLAAYVAPASQVGEAYQTLRTNLRFMAVARDMRSLLITSATSGEGKTTTAANLAVAAARTGARVILVGVDLRRPTLHRLFGVERRHGLTDLLAGEGGQLSDVLVDVDMPNLQVLLSGEIPPNPTELLSSPAMTAVMAQLESSADLVIYDGPPVLAVADALELGPKVGGAVIIVNAGQSGRHAVHAAAERLRSVGAEVVGTVLNNISEGGRDGYYYYGHYYGDYAAVSEGDDNEGRRRRRATSGASAK